MFFVLLSLLVFFPVLFGSALWDDWGFIFRNAALKNAANPLIYFNGSELRAWPVSHTFLWALYKLFKNNYQYYHLISIFIHAFNGFFCFLLLERLKVKNSFLLAVLFLVHPLQLLTVAWIIQIKTLLSIFFLLIAIISLLDYFKQDKIFLYFYSILFFGLSVFSKSTTSIASFCFFFYYLFNRKDLKLLDFSFVAFPFLLISFFSIYSTAWNPQYHHFLLLSALCLFTVFLIFKFYYFFRKNIYYILPFFTFVSFPWNSSLIPPFLHALFLFFLLLVILFFDFFKKIFKDYSAITFLLCLSCLIYFLSFHDSSLNFLNLEIAHNATLTLKNFIRYCIFIILPFNNHLFSTSTQVTFSSLEFLQIFIFYSFFYLLFRNLKKMKSRLIQVGLAFFVMTIIPFCGFIDLPIFSYTNFSPYWLSIPFIGLLPLFSNFIKSTKILWAIVISMLLITHIQSYRFINTENIFLDSIKLNPGIPIFQVSLVEHYVFTGKCEKARATFEEIKETNIAKYFSTFKKVKGCKEKVNQ